MWWAWREGRFSALVSSPFMYLLLLFLAFAAVWFYNISLDSQRQLTNFSCASTTPPKFIFVIIRLKTLLIDVQNLLTIIMVYGSPNFPIEGYLYACLCCDHLFYL